ncbi:uncharacterized protein LOC134187802 isoform X3 [Corticium candelabrum]|uniref:uncharacterized protein LOC134187802 isoform X3 n=1 Tax=Corticium candelabrum TaxID=121492 RepID=UPI002E25F23F|nr:uncharacterized protein LOC134187802 isoform X3 [Corticium candelabrum]
MSQLVTLVSLYLLVSVQSLHQAPAIVTIEAGGITANVDITGTKGSGMVSFQFTSFNSSNDVKLSNITIAVHQLPPSYQSSCTGSDVGDVYDPTGALNSASYSSSCMMNKETCAVGDLIRRLGVIGNFEAKTTNFLNSKWYLSGVDSIIGRSLVMYGSDGGPLACGLIRPNFDKDMQEINFYAKLFSPVGGLVSFKQVVNSSTGMGYDVAILADLHSNDGSASRGNYTWYFASGQLSNSYNCSSFSSPPSLRSDADLSTRHGRLTINQGQGKRLFFTDTTLQLQAISNMVLVVKDSMGRLSCGNVERRLGVIANFTGSIKGYVRCTPGEGGSTLQVSLTGLNGQATDLDIHSYPVDGNSCTGSGDHLDQFGDLLGMESLESKMSVDTSKFSPNLRCDGWSGILGQSVGIHRTDGTLWQCASFEPMVPSDVSTTKKSSVAQFTGMYSGFIRLTQWQLSTGQLTNTIVDIDVRKTGSATTGHNWHIHQTPTAGFADNGRANCGGGYTGGHYNPHNVYLMGNYLVDCNKQNQLRCELGDLSGKHGRYTIESVSSNKGRQLSQDIDLPLFGPTSVAFRSIVIHDPNAGDPRLVCATLYPDGYRPYAVTFMKPTTVNKMKIQEAIASGLGIQTADVMYLTVHTQDVCASASFAVLGTVANTLKSDFESSLVTGNRMFGEYEVDNNCLIQTTATSTPSGADFLHHTSYLFSLLVMMVSFMLF